MFIQVIGTLPNKLVPAARLAVRLRGCRSRNVERSRSKSLARRSRSITGGSYRLAQAACSGEITETRSAIGRSGAVRVRRVPQTLALPPPPLGVQTGALGCARHPRPS